MQEKSEIVGNSRPSEICEETGIRSFIHLPNERSVSQSVSKTTTFIEILSSELKVIFYEFYNNIRYSFYDFSVAPPGINRWEMYINAYKTGEKSL